MNYIKLLNAAFEMFYFDDRLNPTHISLYMALFQEWNCSRFADEFYVNRLDLMRVAKIGSKSTYHRCISELDSWAYLSYIPSNNPYKGSKIKMSLLGPSDEPNTGKYDPKLEQLAEEYRPVRGPVVYPHHPINGPVPDRNRPTSGQVVVSTINNTKQVNNIKRPNSSQVVFDFFKAKGFTADEGKKFFRHYDTRHWKTSDGKDIRDWQAVAVNWMARNSVSTAKNSSNKKEVSQIKDNLRTVQNKDYGQPL